MDDLISRQAAIDTVVDAMMSGADADMVEGLIYMLPSAQPQALIDQLRWERDIAVKQLHDLGYEFGEEPSAQPRTGKWILHYECPKCGEMTSNFLEQCPFCKADMRGEQND